MVTSGPRSTPSRRIIVATTTWAVPAVVVASAAPASAASVSNLPAVFVNAFNIRGYDFEKDYYTYAFTINVKRAGGVPIAGVGAFFTGDGPTSQTGSSEVNITASQGTTDSTGRWVWNLSQPELDTLKAQYNAIRAVGFVPGPGSAPARRYDGPMIGIARGQ